MLRAGQRLRSITLRADANHLLTDVWTSGGVVIGIFLVKVTGVLILDPVVALLVTANIVWTGFRLLRESASGLLDVGLPKEEIKAIFLILNKYKSQGIRFHALRTRIAGTRRFVSFHVLVPGSWTVQQGHDVCEAIELAIIQALPLTSLTSHLEPLEDPASWEDQELKNWSAEINAICLLSTRGFWQMILTIESHVGVMRQAELHPIVHLSTTESLHDLLLLPDSAEVLL